jgi:hypothetical protein
LTPETVQAFLASTLPWISGTGLLESYIQDAINTRKNRIIPAGDDLIRLNWAPQRHENALLLLHRECWRSAANTYRNGVF